MKSRGPYRRCNEVAECQDHDSVDISTERRSHDAVAHAHHQDQGEGQSPLGSTEQNGEALDALRSIAGHVPQPVQVVSVSSGGTSNCRS